MAKRSRLAGRPGQRRPLQRTAPRPETAPPVTSVTPEEEARAAEIEAEIVAEEMAATAAQAARRRGRRPDPEATAGVSYSSVPLAARAAEEYRYVQRDVRRIAVVGGFLLAVLAVLDVLVNGLHLFTL